MFVDDVSAGANQEGLWRSIHTPVNPDAAVFVVGRSDIRIAQLLQPYQSFVTLIPPIEAVDGNDVSACQFEQVVVFLAAAAAPGCPYIDEDQLTVVIGTADGRQRILYTG